MNLLFYFVFQSTFKVAYIVQVAFIKNLKQQLQNDNYDKFK
jgi:hypothetical protein